jgi:rubrerythrin
MDAESFDALLLASIAEEIAARDFYTEAARRVKEANVQSIFEQLAREENLHKETLEAFRSNPLARVEFGRVEDFHVAESEADAVLSFDMGPKEAYQLAMKKEQKAQAIYTRMAEGCRNYEIRSIYLELAEMERGHKTRLEELYINAACPEAW